MVPTLLVLLFAVTDDFTPPPLVSVESTELTPPPMPAAEPWPHSAPPTPPAQVTTPSPATPSDAPAWQAGAWATTTLPTSLEGSAFLYGLRAELAVWRIGAWLTFDRSGVTPFTLNSTDAWTGALGYALLLTRHVRVQALGAVSARSDSGTSLFAPGLGLTARAGWSFLAIEGSALFTPFGGFRQLDARAEAVLVGGIFELHAGLRALAVDTTESGGLDTLFANAPTLGPSIALGLRL